MKNIIIVAAFLLVAGNASAELFRRNRVQSNSSRNYSTYSASQSSNRGGFYRDCYDYVRSTGPIGSPVSHSLNDLRPGDVLNMRGFSWGNSRGSNHWARVESVDGNGNVTISHSNVNGNKGRIVETRSIHAFRGSVTVHR